MILQMFQENKKLHDNVREWRDKMQDMRDYTVFVFVANNKTGNVMYCQDIDNLIVRLIGKCLCGSGTRFHNGILTSFLKLPRQRRML